MKKILTLIALSTPLWVYSMELDSVESTNQQSSGKRTFDASFIQEAKSESAEKEGSENGSTEAEVCPTLKKARQDGEKSVNSEGENEEEAAVASISMLAPEILTQILAYVDDKTLLASATSVCRGWNELLHYVWSERLRNQNQAHLLDSSYMDVWGSAKSIYLFWGLPRNKALIEQLIFKAFGNCDVLGLDTGADDKYGEELDEYLGTEEAKVEIPIKREILNHLLFSPALIKSLYGHNCLTFYHDLKGWNIYTDQFRWLSWIYRLVDESFKDPHEEMALEDFDNEILGLDLSLRNEKHIKLKTIPRHILLLKPVLRRLTISDHHLTEIPEELTQFNNMDQLNLDSNQITHLPATLFTMPKLTSMALNNNQIVSISDLSDSLPNNTSRFDYVDLSDNPLKSIPAHLIERTEELLLDNCHLDALPSANYAEIGNLSVANNNLSTLPRELQNAGNLWGLDLTGNPLPTSLLPQGAIGFNFSTQELVQAFFEKLSLMPEFFNAD